MKNIKYLPFLVVVSICPPSYGAQYCGVPMDDGYLHDVSDVASGNIGNVAKWHLCDGYSLDTIRGLSLNNQVFQLCVNYDTTSTYNGAILLNNCQIDETSFACSGGFMLNAAGTACIKCPDNTRGSTHEILVPHQNKTCGYCAPGYYKLNGNCTACPESGTTDAPGNEITRCYLPAGVTGADTTGDFTITQNCFYKE